jgi:AcrR family transcriptional regulator
MAPAPRSTERLVLIRAAATRVFARFGYRRTTMGEIAAEAGMSRPALYLLYPNKEAIFRDLAEALLSEGLEAAAAAWPPGAPVEPGLEAALLAKELPLFRLLAESPHAAEIFAAGNQALADLHADHEARFIALLAERLEAAGSPEPASRARLVAHAIHGFKTANASVPGFLADVAALAKLMSR